MTEGNYVLGTIYAPRVLEADQDAYVVGIHYYNPLTEDTWNNIVEVCSENERDLMIRANVILKALNSIDDNLVSFPEVGYI
jgi:hypothetical protein